MLLDTPSKYFSLAVTLQTSNIRCHNPWKTWFILKIPVSSTMVLRLSKALIKTAALPYLLRLPNCLDSSLLQLSCKFLRHELRFCGLETDYLNCNICKLLISATAGVNFSPDNYPSVVLVTRNLVNKLFVSWFSSVSFPSWLLIKPTTGEELGWNSL